MTEPHSLQYECRFFFELEDSTREQGRSSRKSYSLLSSEIEKSKAPYLLNNLLITPCYYGLEIFILLNHYSLPYVE